MSKKIFVNLPVAGLQRPDPSMKQSAPSTAHQFSDNTAVCMVITDHLHVMLLTHKWATFTQKPHRRCPSRRSHVVPERRRPRRSTAWLRPLPLTAAGGREPLQDHGFIMATQLRGLWNGHIWEIMFMDMSQMPQG